MIIQLCIQFNSQNCRKVFIFHSYSSPLWKQGKKFQKMRRHYCFPFRVFDMAKIVGTKPPQSRCVTSFVLVLIHGLPWDNCLKLSCFSTLVRHIIFLRDGTLQIFSRKCFSPKRSSTLTQSFLWKANLCDLLFISDGERTNSITVGRLNQKFVKFSEIG